METIFDLENITARFSKIVLLTKTQRVRYSSVDEQNDNGPA